MKLLQTETNIGLIRKNNEDAVVAINHPKKKDIILLAVADGMGGKEHGEIASNYTIDTISKWFKEKDPKTLNNTSKVQELVEKLIYKINDDIIKKYKENHTGTTLTLAIVNKTNTLFFNVGDSRAYIYKKNKLIQITEDASDVWFYYKYGACKKDDLRYFFNNNIITSCIGLTDNLCKVTTHVIENDYDMTLLFTDGVTDIITDRKIHKLIKKNEKRKILASIINEAVNVDQNLHVPLRLKRKKYSKYILPFKGRDNATGAIYIKNV